jgi:DNA-binding NtrC family response regulator
MFARIFLVEDEEELLAYCAERLRETGFSDIVAFRNTVNIVQEIEARLDRPAILVSDFFVSPSPLSRYLPELRAKGVNLPVVILSGKCRPEQLNDLALHCQLSGMFVKGIEPALLMSQLAKHLAELNEYANDAFHTYQMRKEVALFLRDYPQAQDRSAMLALLAFKSVKELEDDLPKNRLYGLQKALTAFLGREDVARRYAVLNESLLKYQRSNPELFMP